MIRRSDIKVSGNPFNLIIGLFIIIVFLFGLFRLASFVYRILAAVSPVLLIATAIIDHTVITDYAKRIGNLIKRNPWLGVGAVALTIVAFPLVAAFLLSRAISRKNSKKQEANFQRYDSGAEEWINYEELESKTKTPNYRSYDEDHLVQ